MRYLTRYTALHHHHFVRVAARHLPLHRLFLPPPFLSTATMAFAVVAPGAFADARARVSTCRARPTARAPVTMGEKDKYATVGDKAQAIKDAEMDGSLRGPDPTAPGSVKDTEGITSIYPTVQPMRVAVDEPTDVKKVVASLFVAVVVGFAILAVVPFNKEAKIVVEQGEAPAVEVGLPASK